MHYMLYLFLALDACLQFIRRLFFKERSAAGSIAVVTGGAMGIGRSLATQLLKRGAIVVIIDVKKSVLEQTANELRASGKDYTVHTYVCDVSKSSEVSSTMNKITHEVGEIDMLFNNAGIIYATPIMETEISQIERTIQVNLLAHFYTVKSVLPKMKHRGKGMIVNTASIAGIMGAPTLTAYSASKFGVVGLSEALRNELILEKSPITVHVAMPFMIRTAMNDIYCPPAVTKDQAISRLSTPEYCAEIIVSESLMGRFKIYVPPSNVILSAIRGLFPTWLLDIIGADSGMMTLEAK